MGLYGQAQIWSVYLTLVFSATLIAILLFKKNRLLGEKSREIFTKGSKTALYASIFLLISLFLYLVDEVFDLLNMGVLHQITRTVHGVFLLFGLILFAILTFKMGWEK
jgi:hypothetical protein